MTTSAALIGDAVGLDDFLTWTEWSLARVGFRPLNCLPIVATCRDELMADVDEAVAEAWGRPFQAGALGGLVFVGRTGIQAALGHVPGEDGRHRLVVFVLPHLGIDADGVVGRVQRRGMYRASAACGALAAFRDELVEGRADVGVDPDDIEQSFLRGRLRQALGTAPVPTLAELTELARCSAVEDMHRYIALARGSEPVDVAYISGIVLHLPRDVDLVASVEAQVDVDGVVVQLPH
jgi:hypothetical protein